MASNFLFWATYLAAISVECGHDFNIRSGRNVHGRDERHWSSPVLRIPSFQYSFIAGPEDWQFASQTGHLPFFLASAPPALLLHVTAVNICPSDLFEWLAFQLLPSWRQNVLLRSSSSITVSLSLSLAPFRAPSVYNGSYSIILDRSHFRWSFTILWRSSMPASTTINCHLQFNHVLRVQLLCLNMMEPTAITHRQRIEFTVEMGEKFPQILTKKVISERDKSSMNNCLRHFSSCGIFTPHLFSKSALWQSMFKSVHAHTLCFVICFFSLHKVQSNSSL